MTAAQQVAKAMPCTEKKCALRVRQTFFELVHDAADGLGIRRVSSDPAIYGNYAKACSGQSGCQGEQNVDYALSCLSDDESDVDMTATRQHDRVRSCGSTTCTTRSASLSHWDGELDSESELDVDFVQNSSSYVYGNESCQISTPNMFPMYQPAEACPLHYDLDELAPLSIQNSVDEACHDCANASASERTSAAWLLAENERLATENNLLRENMRLATENQPSDAAFALACSLRPWSHMGATIQPMTVERASSQRASVRKDPAEPSTLGRAGKAGHAKYASAFSSPSVHSSEHQEDTRTTVMWRNLPNSYNRTTLLKLLDESGFSGFYDFVYMPIDFKTHASLGYAFINLTGPHAVQRFWQQFQGYSRWAVPSKKASYVSWSDSHQGLAMNVGCYQNSPIMHESVPDEYKPAVFVNGVRMSFPAPTKQLRAPRYH